MVAMPTRERRVARVVGIAVDRWAELAFGANPVSGTPGASIQPAKRTILPIIGVEKFQGEPFGATLLQ